MFLWLQYFLSVSWLMMMPSRYCGRILSYTPLLAPQLILIVIFWVNISPHRGGNRSDGKETGDLLMVGPLFCCGGEGSVFLLDAVAADVHCSSLSCLLVLEVFHHLILYFYFIFDMYTLLDEKISLRKHLLCWEFLG
ncbi:hypothetical protein Ancab_026644 [Ancistrocladus abbreviatus]